MRRMIYSALTIKSAFIPAVKSILASNDEDEKKRRDARRKSLGTLCSANC